MTGNNQGALNTELLGHLCVLDQLGIIRRCDRDWPVPNERLTRILGRASEGNTPDVLVAGNRIQNLSECCTRCLIMITLVSYR